MNETFFGYGSAESFYDKRRHINVIFQLLMMYKLKAIPSVIIPQLQQALRLPMQDAAELVCMGHRTKRINVGETKRGRKV